MNLYPDRQDLGRRVSFRLYVIFKDDTLVSDDLYKKPER